MDGEAIITISAAVVALTQLVKWAGVPRKYAPVVVLLLAAIGVAMWAVSQPAWSRGDVWSYFAGWVAVSTSAAGVYGFATSEAAHALVSRGSGRGG